MLRNYDLLWPNGVRQKHLVNMLLCQLHFQLKVFICPFWSLRHLQKLCFCKGCSDSQYWLTLVKTESTVSGVFLHLQTQDWVKTLTKLRALKLQCLLKIISKTNDLNKCLPILKNRQMEDSVSTLIFILWEPLIQYRMTAKEFMYKYFCFDLLQSNTALCLAVFRHHTDFTSIFPAMSSLKT